MLPDKKLKVLVVGSGGREHALCWKIAQSEHVRHVFCAPGNGGTGRGQRSSNVAIKVNDFAALLKFCQEEVIDLVVIGPDNALADGIVDYLQAAGIRVFGPRKQSAKLEWSKLYAKQFMESAGLPTARFTAQRTLAEAKQAVRTCPWLKQGRCVVKVDGLALGKGVFVCNSEAEADAALEAIFVEKSFGQAGAVVLLEERLEGEELSLLVLCDGKTLVTMPACQDHKRRQDGDRGPNTGGMGAYSPVPLYEQAQEAIEKKVVAPLKQALQRGVLPNGSALPEEIRSYQGVLYFGLMLERAGENSSQQPAAPRKEEETPSSAVNASDGRTGAKEFFPYVLEFNARFGDPEAQALLPRLRSDLLEALWATTEGQLNTVTMQWSSEASCCVVAVAASYPSGSSRGEPIVVGGVDKTCSTVFHAGTKRDEAGQLLTDGGRILAVTSLAPDMERARERAYEALEHISFSSMDFRTDIAARAVRQCQSS